MVSSAAARPAPQGAPGLARRLANARLLADLPAALARAHRQTPPATRLDIGPYPVAYIGDPETVRAMLDARVPGIAERGRFFEEIARVIGTSSLVTCEGEQHRRLRRMIAPAFRPEQVATYASTMVSAAAELAASWRDGDCIDLGATMSSLTLEIAARALVGIESAAGLDELATVLAAGAKLFYRLVLPRRLSDPLWRSRLSPVNRRLHAAQEALDRYVAGLLAQRRAQPALPEPGGFPPPAPNLLDVLLAARDEDGSPLGDEELRDQIVTFLFAGHETTAQALTWAVLELARHPEVQQRLVAEAAEVLGGRLPEPADLPRLAYTRAVVRETLRLSPPAWFFAREAIADTELDGCPLRAGTLVLASALVLGRDERRWPQATLFKPERWLAAGAAGASPPGFLPFGFGRHNCIGSSFAQVEMALVLATLVPRWRLVVRDPGAVRARATVTLRPRGAVAAKLERRSRGGAAAPG